VILDISLYARGRPQELLENHIGAEVLVNLSLYALEELVTLVLAGPTALIRKDHEQVDILRESIDQTVDPT
jgi:hypothetical protein